MAIFDEFEAVREFAVEAAHITANKTRRMGDIARANLAIQQQEEKILIAQTEIGKIYYRDYISGDHTDRSQYLIHCRKIDEAKRTIVDLRDYIDRLKTGQDI